MHRCDLRGKRSQQAGPKAEPWVNVTAVEDTAIVARARVAEEMARVVMARVAAARARAARARVVEATAMYSCRSSTGVAD